MSKAPMEKINYKHEQMRNFSTNRNNKNEMLEMKIKTKHGNRDEECFQQSR